MELGLSLLVRDDIALLRLDERIVGPGLALRDYEAEIPEVVLPWKAPAPSVAEFRHSRCHARQLTLEFDPQTLLNALQACWVGRTFEGVTVEHVALDPCGSVGPQLKVSGRLEDGAWRSDVWVLDLHGHAQHLEIRPQHHWVFGASHPCPELWHALGRAAGLSVQGNDVLRFDPSRHALMRTFVTHGWKAPDVSSLRIADLQLGARRCVLRLGRDLAPAPGRLHGTEDPPLAAAITAALAPIAAGLGGDPAQKAQALSQLDALTELLRPLPLVHTAALAWLADRLRHAGASVPQATAWALGAVQRWLAQDPSNPLARRWQVELLARTHRYGDLARLTAEAGEAQSDAETQLLNDVALAQLYGAKLGNRQQALERLQRWSEQSPPHPRLQLTLARLEAGTPERALATLTTALSTVEDPEQRFADRLSVAMAMTEARQFDAASRQLALLLEEGTADPQNRAELRALASRLGEHRAALDLLRDELAAATPQERAARATQLALHACAAGSPDAKALVLAALAGDPGDPDLLRWSAQLHERAEQWTVAIDALERLQERSPPSAETQSRLARVLVQRGHQHHKHGELEAAEADWSRASELTANLDAAPLLFLAERALQRGEPQQAMAWLERLLQRPDAPHEAWSVLARATALVDDPPHAIEDLLRDPEHRIRLLEAIIEQQTGAARLEALFERAQLWLDSRNHPEHAIADLEAILEDDPLHEHATRLLATLYGRLDRFRDRLTLLERLFLREQGRKRCETLREIARIYRETLLDLPRAEQALRLALDHLGEALDAQTRDFAEALRAELVSDLQRQGRFVDLSIYLGRALEPELEGRVPASDWHHARIDRLVELARIYRGPLDDEQKAARVYERLEQCGHLPDEGLATLARAFRRAGRHSDLVRILDVRGQSLAAQGEHARKAAVDVRIAEVLEGPVGRPHEAADYYLEAYLADPAAHAAAGARARVLYAGVDAVANVRRKLLTRMRTLPVAQRPGLLTLLGDILGPHDDYEEEAEQRYREALEIDPDDAFASEALGRLLARQGRLDAAVGPLVAAATHPALDPTRAADDAAIAARALLELDKPAESELVLKAALQRAPDSQRALLELARLYERVGRPSEQAIVLEELSELPLSSMLSAEVAYRRAALLLPNARVDPFCPEAERARAYLLEAVSADSKHVAARQTLLELAHGRLEWSIVAHMHYLAIRELPSGPPRALVHLDLAETYLDHLQDLESATRNIESAIQQAPGDLVVSSRAGALAARLPETRKVAERFERIATMSQALDVSSRARLWLLAADLHLSEDDPAAAEAACQAVLALPRVPPEAAAAATRNLELLAFDEARDLRQQKSGLLRLLDAEDHGAERMHILRRLREIGTAMDDGGFIEWASREQLGLALDEAEFEGDLGAATAALRELYAERGDYQEIVDLYRALATRVKSIPGQAEALLEAARFTHHGLRDPGGAIVLLQDCLARAPGWVPALQMLGELTRECDDPSMQADVYRHLMELDPRHRPLPLDLELGRLARALGRETEAAALLRPLTVQAQDNDIRFSALRELDALLATSAGAPERVPVMRRYLDECHGRGLEEAGRVAYSLAKLELQLGNREGALQSVHKGLSIAADHRGLLELDVQLLEESEQRDGLARALERLAMHVPDAGEQARLFIRAARQRLDHPHPRADNIVRKRAIIEARRLLTHAAEVAPQTSAAQAELLPIAFSEGRWDEVLELAVSLREHGHEDEEALILAALSEAYRHGQRALARDLGYRHGPEAHARFLYPGLRQLLTEVATRGPLPRLDALLSAATTLAGGRVRLAEGMRRWATGRPIQAGLALGLARLAEADGHAEIARSLYQISAFMAPQGPVSALAARLPPATPPPSPSADPASVLATAGPLQLLLLRHRAAIPSTPPPTAPQEPALAPADADLQTRWALADTILEPWRRHFALSFGLRWSEAVVPGGVGTDAHDDAPTIVLSAGVGACSVAELRYRLAYAVAGLLLGHTLIARDAEGPQSALEGLRRRLLDPDTPISGDSERWVELAETLPASSHRVLVEELTHVLHRPGGLEHWLDQLDRARMSFACRLSGQLDGALFSIAHDQGHVHEGRPDPVGTLRSEDATWLLRALGLY